MSLFDALFVAHLVGDWILQNDWQARNKSKSKTSKKARTIREKTTAMLEHDKEFDIPHHWHAPSKVDNPFCAALHLFPAPDFVHANSLNCE